MKLFASSGTPTAGRTPALTSFVTNKTAAIRYARALLDVAIKEKADLEQIERELAQFVDLFTQHPMLEKVLINPAVPVPRKRAAVADLLGAPGFSPIVSKLLTLLADRDRLVLVPELLAAYGERLLDYRNVVRAEVTTAAPIDAERTQAIQARPGEADRPHREARDEGRPVDHRRDGGAHRQHGVRRQRHEAAARG